MTTRDAVTKRASSMISKMRSRTAEKKAASGRIMRRARRVPFGLPALRGWLYMVSVGGTGELWECSYCTRQLTIAGIEADHVVSLNRGGSPGLENLKIACKLCNQTKGEMSLESFQALMEGLKSFPSVDRAYILKCLRTAGVGQRLRFPQKPTKPAPAGVEEPLP